MTTFFTSDLHLGHKRIAEYTGRPWADVDEMDEALIEGWNQRVTKNDTVYHLGDFSFADSGRTAQHAGRLKGNICFILGNHDEPLQKAYKSKLLPPRVQWLRHYHELRFEGQKVVLFHYPIASWHGIHKGSWHLHGHSHGNFDQKGQPMMDVGVDATASLTDYAPISFEEISEILSSRTFIPVDHHGAD